MVVYYLEDPITYWKDSLTKAINHLRFVDLWMFINIIKYHKCCLCPYDGVEVNLGIFFCSTTIPAQQWSGSKFDPPPQARPLEAFCECHTRGLASNKRNKSWPSDLCVFAALALASTNIKRIAISEKQEQPTIVGFRWKPLPLQTVQPRWLVSVVRNFQESRLWPLLKASSQGFWFHVGTGWNRSQGKHEKQPNRMDASEFLVVPWFLSISPSDWSRILKPISLKSVLPKRCRKKKNTTTGTINMEATHTTFPHAFGFSAFGHDFPWFPLDLLSPMVQEFVIFPFVQKITQQGVGIWLVVGPPLWKIWVRQLGWLATQYMGK